MKKLTETQINKIEQLGKKHHVHTNILDKEIVSLEVTLDIHDWAIPYDAEEQLERLDECVEEVLTELPLKIVNKGEALEKVLNCTPPTNDIELVVLTL